jgi:hypothetical protein
MPLQTSITTVSFQVINLEDNSTIGDVVLNTLELIDQ